MQSIPVWYTPLTPKPNFPLLRVSQLKIGLFRGFWQKSAHHGCFVKVRPQNPKIAPPPSGKNQKMTHFVWVFGQKMPKM